MSAFRPAHPLRARSLPNGAACNVELGYQSDCGLQPPPPGHAGAPAASPSAVNYPAYHHAAAHSPALVGSSYGMLNSPHGIAPPAHHGLYLPPDPAPPEGSRASAARSDDAIAHMAPF